jgi:hypothetical protein
MALFRLGKPAIARRGACRSQPCDVLSASRSLFSGNIAIALARWPPSFGDAKYRETVYQIEDNKLGYSRGLIVGPTVSCVAVLQRR